MIIGKLIGYLAEALKYLMIFCDWICGHNYWIALLIFALIIKLILFPFGIKQQKSQQKLARLRPKEEAIRRKYRGKTDQESLRKMNEEIQIMYRQEKYSQFSGCLPLLLQMPILFSLYYIIQNPLHYICKFGNAQIEVIMETYNRLTGYSGAAAYSNLTIKATSWISSDANRQALVKALPIDGTVPLGAGFDNYGAFRADLVQKIEGTQFPKFKMFGFIDLSVTPSEQILFYILVPIITFALLVVTMKLQKKFTYQPISAEIQKKGATAKIMEYVMPGISAVFAFTLPSALALYWIYQNLLGFGQQVLLAKLFPTPKMSEAEIKEALKEADRQAYEAKKAEEKRRKALYEEEKALAEETREKGVPEGWVEPMGRSSSDTNGSDKAKGKKSKVIDRAEMKNDNDKKEDE